MLISASLERIDNHPIAVRLFGEPQIVVDGLRVESTLSAKSLLLFALLVTRKGDTLSRAELAFNLWPDLCESEARAALRRQIYRLQRALSGSGARLSCGSKTIAWCPGDDTWVDVLEFERLSESPETFAAAAQLYAGDFAPYVEHDWATETRDRLRRRFLDVLDDLIRERCASGDVRGALFYVERLLREDPWREGALRQLMMLRFAEGDRAGALACYRDFRNRLRAEFDVEPMAETVRCHESIAQGVPHLQFAGVEGRA